MFQRHRLEKEEGKTYNEPGVSCNPALAFIDRELLIERNVQVSDQMKALNRRFGMLHGISSLANLGAVIALGFHGLWIGQYGVKGN